jgi:predicted PurR-regulated permease PerM
MPLPHSVHESVLRKFVDVRPAQAKPTIPADGMSPAAGRQSTRSPSGAAAEPRPDLARATIGVLAIVTLIALTIWVLHPFLASTIWASLIAIATWPVMTRLQGWLWGSRAAATTVMTLALLLLLVVPLTLVIGTIASNADGLVQWAATLKSMTIPPPPEWLARVPLIGQPIVDGWNRLAESRLADLAATVTPYVVAAILWLASTLKGFALLMLQLLLTVAIAAVMYAKGEHAAEALLKFGRQLAGDHGDHVIRLAGQAIRAVALGVVVTACAQAALAGLGLLVAGIPFAPVLTALAFVLCIAQMGPTLVLAPSIAWLFWSGATGTGTLLLAWSVLVIPMDNVLRPILMTKGANLPMLLMFTGVMGGLLAFGLIGIFVGPVVLAIAYTLLGAWIAAAPAPSSEAIDRQVPVRETLSGKRVSI